MKQDRRRGLHPLDPRHKATLRAREELRELYAELDAAYGDWSCEDSTHCCRFGLSGKEPYVTHAEWELMREAFEKLPLKRQRNRPRLLPVLNTGADEQVCPLLDDDGRCSIYEARPIGCRTFFCERAFEGRKISRDLLRDAVAKVRELSEGMNPRGSSQAGAGRPLRTVLKEYGLVVQPTLPLPKGSEPTD